MTEQMQPTMNDPNVKVEILDDVLNKFGDRFTVFSLTINRFLLAEWNTHKIINKNWRSSRAVPAKVLLKEVRENPACPILYLKNQPGMQGGLELSGESRDQAELIWREAAKSAADYVERLDATGLHKSWCNRLIEPYLYCHGISSGTEFENLFNLRLKQVTGGAQPEFVHVAQKLKIAIDNSSPKPATYGQWILPYITQEELTIYSIVELILISAARMARVSYKQFDGTINISKDKELAKNLTENGHLSPFEHICTPDYKLHGKWVNPHLHGTLNGFIQARRVIELYGMEGLNQYCTNFGRYYEANI